MELPDDCTLVFSRILLITLKSQSFSFSLVGHVSYGDVLRVILCSIRDLGGCPCPRCRIPMDQVPELGTKLDANRCKSLQRHDDDDKRYKISLSRKFIYEQGRNVTSEAVEKVLKGESLTPTRVCALCVSSFRS